MTSDLIAGLLFLAPGFLALKLFYLFGAQRPRSDWEWAAWSVVASIPISVTARLVRGVAGEPPEVADPLEVVLRVASAMVLGFGLVGVWYLLNWLPFAWASAFVERLQDSVWDHVLSAEVDAGGRAVELVLADGARYQGTIRWAGREDAGAEPWIYLRYVKVFDAGAGEFREAEGTHGILVHKDEIRRLRIRKTPLEASTADHTVTDTMSGT